MRSSEAQGHLAAALAKAQGEFPVIPKTKTGKIEGKTQGGRDYSYEYKYADLDDIKAVVQPILSANGLAVSQMPEWEESHNVLSTRVMHESGEWLEGTMRLFLAKEAPQAHGSAITYAQRYAYKAALGLQAEEDDDGRAAQAFGHGTGQRRPENRTSAQETQKSGNPDTVASSGKPDTAAGKPGQGGKFDGMITALNEAGAMPEYVRWRREAKVNFPETPEQVAEVRAILAAARARQATPTAAPGVVHTPAPAADPLAEPF
jgi:hypothetical protein